MNILISLSSVLLGKALQELLEREPEGYQTLSVSDVLQRGEFQPDFIVVDSCTIRNCVPFQNSDTKIVLLDSCLGDQEMTSLLLSYKIDGVMSTTSDLPLFKKALDVVMAGQLWIDNNRIKAIVRQGEQKAKLNNQEESFSKKEREIIILVSQGLTNRAIGDNLHISEQTVKTHLSRIFRKTNISRRSQLVPFAMKLRVPNSL